MVRIRLISSALVAFSLVAAAVPQKPMPKATVELPRTVVSGKPFLATLKVTIPYGWHGYANPPMKDYEVPVSVKAGSTNMRLRKTTYPKGVVKQFNGEDAKVYEGTVKIPMELVVVGKPGAAKVSFKVNYQLCDDKSCIPPDNLTVTQTVTLKKS